MNITQEVCSYVALEVTTLDRQKLQRHSCDFWQELSK